MGSNESGEQAERPNLYGLDRTQLTRFLERYPVPPFHAEQIYSWLYARHSLSPEAWTDLPRTLREQLAEHTAVEPGRISERSTSRDGTVKYRIGLPGGGDVEAVYMTAADRRTICISSQIGCALRCDFCLTGKMGFNRHLTPGEIVGQVSLIMQEQRLGEARWRLVFMGMGEPLHNYTAVQSALGLLTDPRGFGMSRKSITVSTSGIAPAIERLAGELVVPQLAVSLNATTDRLRDRLMPINRKYPLGRLLAACHKFTESSGDRITFEYVLLEGINDTQQDMQRLAGMVRRTRAKLNLIPFNQVPGQLSYQSPERERILALRDGLLAQRVPVSIRWSAGADARAACGQLAIENTQQ